MHIKSISVLRLYFFIVGWNPSFYFLLATVFQILDLRVSQTKLLVFEQQFSHILDLPVSQIKCKLYKKKIYIYIGQAVQFGTHLTPMS